jgi:hypothetical protein
MRESLRPGAETSTRDGTVEGPALPVPDRDSALVHAAELIGAAWRRFNSPRQSRPLPNARERELLGRAEPAPPSGPNQRLDAVTEVLNHSLAESAPQWCSCFGSSRLEIGGAVPEVVASVACSA